MRSWRHAGFGAPNDKRNAVAWGRMVMLKERLGFVIVPTNPSNVAQSILLEESCQMVEPPMPVLSYVFRMQRKASSDNES